jgi:hypothetical protein
MLEIKTGHLQELLFARPGLEAYSVLVDGQLEKCLVYTDMVSQVQPGDQVILNTTAESLGLGSGGYHYVVAP